MKSASVLAAVLAVLALPSLAAAADYGAKRAVHGRGEASAEARGFTGALPACNDPGVEAHVISGFAATEREYWASDLALSPFVAPREIDYRPWGGEFIPRRFCEAKVVTNDGRKRVVVYNIREDQGFASIGYGVEWCVTGIDRHYSYAPRCKMAAP
ncbi:hypothetical protein [Methylopila sp. M107]|uniref:hypothetical protein n=1 Tax=Methylopila sp. M107 TaxID=1101190 RepID=UPI00036C7190|nr:hypothetical protein [Methylopila sp. M107]